MKHLHIALTLAILITSSHILGVMKPVFAQSEKDQITKPDVVKTEISTKDDSAKSTGDLINVKTQTLNKSLTLSGNFHPLIIDEIIIRPEVWIAYKIQKIVSHGTKVNKGDVLIQFETKDLDEEITKLKVTLESKTLAFKQAVEDFKIYEELYPQELEVAENNLAYLKEDREYAKKVSYPLQVETLEFSKKSADNAVSYAEEELKQLLKMYKEDGLTEETEEIVLKRTKDSFERAQFGKKLSDAEYNKDKTVSLPRQQLADEKTYLQKELELTKNLKMLPVKKLQKQLEMFKMEKDGKDTQDLLQKHLKDRELCTITAPSDGIVYYGEVQQGTMLNASAYAKLMVRDGTPPLRKTILSIFNPGKLVIHGLVEEADALTIKPGQTIKSYPKADPDRLINGKIATIDSLPNVDGKFPVSIEIEKQADLTGISPAMTCKCTLNVIEIKNALAIPKSALFQADDQSSFVYLKVGESFQKQTIKAGQKVNDMVEIKEGLKTGDVISSKEPAAKN